MYRWNHTPSTRFNCKNGYQQDNMLYPILCQYIYKPDIVNLIIFV